jgi:hypothetical protein
LEPQDPSGATLNLHFLAAVVTLLVIKLLVIAEREIVPERDDNIGYVRYSSEYFPALLSGAASHPPGASLIMATARFLGLPYRVFLEVLLATGVLLLFRPLVSSARITLSTAVFGSVVLLFHPVLVLEMDRAMGDPAAFLCWLIGVAGLLGFVTAPRETFPWRNLALAVVAFAFAGITRTGEGAIVFAVMASAALLAMLMFRADERWRGRRTLVACLCVILANLSATQLLSAVHYANRGYWGATTVESREWWQVYRALLSLPVDRKDRHALIDGPTLALAEELAPTIGNMQGCWAAHSKDWYPKAQAGGFPNSIVQWAFTGCAPGKTSFEKFSSLRQISADIVDNARRRGVELEPPLLGIIPRAAAAWLPELASSFARVSGYVTTIPGSTRVDYTSWDRLGPAIDALFDRGLLRRSALVAKGANPEVPLYLGVIEPSYRVLTWLIVPLTAIAIGAAAAAPLRRRVILGPADRVVLLFLILILLESAARICFYSVVDWIGWKIPPRYIVGARVLPVVGVSIVLGAWSASVARRAFLMLSVCARAVPQFALTRWVLDPLRKLVAECRLPGRLSATWRK